MLTYLFCSILNAGGILLKSIVDPSVLKIYGEYLLISEVKTCKVYMYNSKGDLLKILGAKGQGPAETTSVGNFQIFSTEILISAPSKTIVFDSSGKFLNEIKHSFVLNDVFKIKTGWLGTETIQIQKNLLSCVNLYDSNFQKKKQLLSIQLPSPFSVQIEAIENCFGMETYGDSIIIADTTKGCFFSIFSMEGNLKKSIEKKDYPVVEITQEWKDKIIKELKASPIIAQNWEMLKDKIHFPKNFPAFENYAVSEMGMILLRTYFEKEGRTLFLLINDDGINLNEFYLPGEIEKMNKKRHFCLTDKFIFYIIESKDENFELYQIPIEFRGRCVPMMHCYE